MEFSTITTAYGVTISYRKIGEGPALVLVHGGLQCASNFNELARLLANDFTVYVPNRRGRSISDAYADQDGLEVEASDIQALLQHTGAKYIFGLSSGAIITLEAALQTPTLTKVAIYEPPIQLTATAWKKLESNYDKAIRKNNLGKALIAIIKSTGDRSFSLVKILPAFLTAPFMNLAIRAQPRDIKGREPALRDLVPIFYHDLLIVKQSSSLMEQVKQLHADVLLMGGKKSSRLLTQILDRLAIALPHAQRIAFRQYGHLAADNSGNPPLVADALRQFFLKPIHQH